MILNRLKNYQKALQTKWNSQAASSKSHVEEDYRKRRKRGIKYGDCQISETEAFKLHKFENKWQQERGLDSSTNLGVKEIVQTEYYSTFMPGLTEFIRYQQSVGKVNVNMETVQKKLSKTDSKRTDLKRTLLPIHKTDGNGFRLEKKVEFQIPQPKFGNNLYEKHSMIDKSVINREFKGPLYCDAGRICIGLTAKYAPLDTFRF